METEAPGKRSSENVTTSNKNAAVAPDANKRLRSSAPGKRSAKPYDIIPAECRRHILSFLVVENQETLPLVPPALGATIDCADFNGGLQRTDYLLQALVLMQKTGFLGRFTKLRLENSHELETMKLADVQRIVQGVKIHQVTSLDLSVQENVPTFHHFRGVVPKALGLLLPNLREIDLSNTKFTCAALGGLVKNCPLLEKVTYKNQDGCTILSGACFKASKNLKELNLDNSRFSGDGISMRFHDMHTIPEEGFFMFCLCSANLERVSFKNTEHDFMEFLIKFVLRAPKLNWFASDLSPQLVAQLQVERPEITFV